MPNQPLRAIASPLRQVPREIVTILGAALAIFVVVATGGMIASALPDRVASTWLVFASYAAPAAVAFIVFWWLDQRR